MARQEALEEEERLEAAARREEVRAVSPGLAAARNVASTRDFSDQSHDKMEMMRLERIREMEEMRRARENMTEEDYVVSNERSEATRELEAFRASRGGGTIRDRYNPDTEPQQPAQSRSQTFTKAPKMRV